MQYTLFVYIIYLSLEVFLLLRNSPKISIQMDFPIRYSISNIIIVIKLQVYLRRN